jgi:opacity protein-like surface antigen
LPFSAFRPHRLVGIRDRRFIWRKRNGPWPLQFARWFVLLLRRLAWRLFWRFLGRNQRGRFRQFIAKHVWSARGLLGLDPGAEWDFDWTSLDATGNGRFVPGVGNLQGSANTRWISTLAARFGVVVNNGVLLYGKAGGGWVDNSATITNLTTGASISASNRNSGWVVGAGVEWAIAGNWSAKLEYDFLKLDDLTFGPGPFRGDTFTASRESHCATITPFSMTL